MTTTPLPSKRASSFKKQYARLPEHVRREPDQACQRFKADPDYPGLNFKRIVGSYYSARVGGGHRALAVRHAEHWLWFWIGTPADYSRFMDRLRRGRQGV